MIITTTHGNTYDLEKMEGKLFFFNGQPEQYIVIGISIPMLSIVYTGRIITLKCVNDGNIFSVTLNDLDRFFKEDKMKKE